MGLGLGAKEDEALCGVIVGVCGPVGLSDDASRAIARVDNVKRNSVGGVELHEEYVYPCFDPVVQLSNILF